MGEGSRRLAIVALGLTVVLGTSATATAAQPAHRPAARTARRYYVSLGDSYAVGYQPGRGITRHGFADQIVTKATRRGYHLQLVNFGCGGATTTSILHAPGCPVAARARGGPDYRGATQAAAAESFLQAH